MSVQFSQRVEASVLSRQPIEVRHSFSLERSGAGVQTFAQRTAQSAPNIAFSDASNLVRGLGGFGSSGMLTDIIERLMQRAGQRLPPQLTEPFSIPGGLSQGGFSKIHVRHIRIEPERSSLQPTVRFPAPQPGGNGMVVMPKPGTQPQVDRPPTDKPSQGVSGSPSDNSSKPSQGSAPIAPEPKPEPTPVTTPEPKPTPAPEPTPAPKPEPAPAPEPVSGTAPGGSASRIDRDELATVDAVDDILRRSNYGSSLSQSDITELTKIYGDFRLEDATTHRLNDYATTAAESFLEDPAIIAHAQNWDNYSASQRAQAARAVWDVYSDILGIPDTVSFDTISNPRNEDGTGTGGYYDTGSRTVVVNIHETAHRNFAEMTSVLLHEAVHAKWERELAHIPRHKAADMFRDGEITFEEFMLQTNLLLYLDPRTVSFAEYAMNPHEQLAFTAEMLYRDALRDGGTEVRERLPSGHPLHQHLRDMHLISPNAAMT